MPGSCHEEMIDGDHDDIARHPRATTWMTPVPKAPHREYLRNARRTPSTTIWVTSLTHRGHCERDLGRVRSNPGQRVPNRCRTKLATLGCFGAALRVHADSSRRPLVDDRTPVTRTKAAGVIVSGIQCSLILRGICSRHAIWRPVGISRGIGDKPPAIARSGQSTVAPRKRPSRAGHSEPCAPACRRHAVTR
jgi:hypothetical protein